MRRLCFFLLILGIGCLNVHAGKDKSELDKIKLDEKQRLQETEFFMDASRAKMLGDFTQAKTLFEKVLEINPHNAAAHYELAMLYLASNQYEKAEMAAFNATDLMPTNKWYRDAYRQAISKGGKFEKAAKLMEKIVKDEPRNIENYFEWAYLLLNAGKYKEGVDVYNQLEKITGISEEISIEKEKILLKINDVKGAAEELKKLINAFPNEIRYQLMLGEVYQVNKFKKEARVVYQNILDKESTNPYALYGIGEHL
ncbi:MAG: tetratricopeptide repeat protein [Bacteroidetes bacterium]|nr:tetratricopeptide repeat protein [Bacteroidota bacterium]